jgi:hypothetical protein
MMGPRIVVGIACLSISIVAARPAHAEAIDPAFRSDIEKLLDVTGSAKSGVLMSTLMAGQMLDGLRKSRPDISEKAIALTKEVLEAEFTKAFEGPDGMTSRLVAIYARHFTHAEVIGLLGFYESDLGKKMIGVMPMLIQDSVAAGQEWAMENMPRIRAVLESRLKAEDRPQ